MILESITDFAYFPNLYKSLRELADMAMPESWRFLSPQQPSNNTDTPILERYIRYVFKYLASQHNVSRNASDQQQMISIYGTVACFHTGLMTPHFEDIFALFERSKRTKIHHEWNFRGFFPHSSYALKGVPCLPDKPVYYGILEMFHPEWEIRVNYPHILIDPVNQERLPVEVRPMNNLPLLLHAAVLYGQALAQMEPGIVVPQVYNGRIQYLMPICLTDIRYCDLAMVLAPNEGFYIGSTCLPLEAAYGNARLIGKPAAKWLAGLVDQDVVDLGFDSKMIYGIG